MIVGQVQKLIAARPICHNAQTVRRKNFIGLFLVFVGRLAVLRVLKAGSFGNKVANCATFAVPVNIA